MKEIRKKRKEQQSAVSPGPATAAAIVSRLNGVEMFSGSCGKNAVYDISDAVFR